jgi:hypothetical protein
MNRKSERGRIVCQDRCGAITLVNFAIQDYDATDSSLRLDRQRCYRAVVEHAGALAVIAEDVPADLGGRKFAASHSPQITGVMRPQDFLIGRRMGYAQRLTPEQPRLHQTLPQK